MENRFKARCSRASVFKGSGCDLSPKLSYRRHIGKLIFQMTGKCTDSSYRWILHFSRLDVGSDLGLQYRSSEPESPLWKHTIWNGRGEKGSRTGEVPEWPWCCRHGKAGNSLKEAHGSFAARILPANAPSAVELSRLQRCLGIRRRGIINEVNQINQWKVPRE